MGAGIGKFVRLTCIIYPGKTLVKTWHYTPNFLQKLTHKFLFKFPNKLLIKIVTNKKTRRHNINKVHYSVFTA
jgi:ribosomal protein L16/L10AE